MERASIDGVARQTWPACSPLPAVGGEMLNGANSSPRRICEDTPVNNDLFADLGLPEPWFVAGLQFDEGERLLTVRVDFRKGSRFPHGEGGTGHPVHDTRTRCRRNLNFFQHECVLEVRTPRVRLPGSRAATVNPP